jgi:chromosome segregation ATPase
MTIPTPQEVQELLTEMQKEAAVIARLGIKGWGNLLTNAADALSAYQREVATLRERVAPLDEGPVCLLADYQAMRERAEAAEQEVERLTGRADMLSAAHTLAHTANKELLAQLNAAEARVRELEQDNATLTKAIAMRNAEVSTWMRDAFDAQDRVTDAQAEARQSAFAEAAQMVASLGAQSEDAYVRDALQNCAVVLAKATPPIHTEEP